MPTPSILCGPAAPPPSTADSAGSTATSSTFGLLRLSASATPREEAALPRDEREPRAERRHLVQLVAAERVGADDVDGVALRGADQRERGAGAPARVLDDRVARPQPPVAFGPRDDGLGHPILHAARRVFPFELDEDLRAALRHD